MIFKQDIQRLLIKLLAGIPQQCHPSLKRISLGSAHLVIFGKLQYLTEQEAGMAAQFVPADHCLLDSTIFKPQIQN